MVIFTRYNGEGLVQTFETIHDTEFRELAPLPPADMVWRSAEGPYFNPLSEERTRGCIAVFSGYDHDLRGERARSIWGWTFGGSYRCIQPPCEA